ncbi:MAG: hypothetical protein N2109_02865 [Fimbriimonadales bacterium]|nr:hypothetical protein [Fimbriimonadales bacterium]
MHGARPTDDLQRPQAEVVVLGGDSDAVRLAVARLTERGVAAAEGSEEAVRGARSVLLLDWGWGKPQGRTSRAAAVAAVIDARAVPFVRIASARLLDAAVRSAADLALGARGVRSERKAL